MLFCLSFLLLSLLSLPSLPRLGQARITENDKLGRWYSGSRVTTNLVSLSSLEMDKCRNYETCRVQARVKEREWQPATNKKAKLPLRWCQFGAFGSLIALVRASVNETCYRLLILSRSRRSLVSSFFSDEEEEPNHHIRNPDEPETGDDQDRSGPIMKMVNTKATMQTSIKRER